jgi:glyoxylase-like metal-dependent hydrolase (beta-lactamase superfamily II)
MPALSLPARTAPWLLLLLLVSAPACARAPMALAPGVWWLRGDFVPGQQPDGNSVIFQGRDGLVVVDSGRHAPHSDGLLDFARTQRQPITALINTHWHLDHVGGNPRLRSAHPGLTVYASNAIDAALNGFLARSREQLATMLARDSDPSQQAAMREEIARIDAGPALRPDLVVERAQDFVLAGRPLQLGLERGAATAGDVWIFDPATRTLVVGDLVTLPVPFLDTACPARWQATFAHLEAIPFERLVPGHGVPLSRAGFERYRIAFDRLLACGATDASPASCVATWRNAAGPLLAGQPDALVRGLIEYYVTQRLRGPGAQSDCDSPAMDGSRGG